MYNIENNFDDKTEPMVFTIILVVLAIAAPILLQKFYSVPKKITKQLQLPTKQIQIATLKPQTQWKEVITKDGDSLAAIFQSLKLSSKTLINLLKDTGTTKQLTKIKPGKKFRFKLSGKNQLLKLVAPISNHEELHVQQKNQHFYAKIIKVERQIKLHYATLNINSSIYNAARDSNLPVLLINKLANIFKTKVNFNRDIRKGDSISIIYERYYINGKPSSVGNILATSITNKGKTHKAIYFSYNNHADYYTPAGNNLRQAFDRYPLKFSHISSRFTLNRMHPLLKIKRPHKGVDLAAPVGTPIQSVSSGVITKIGYQHGYGNVIKIKHNNKYSTVYAHMLKFNKNMKRGLKISRGQVIGFVGQSGLATGPHCHFEFHKFNKPTNPTVISLPNAASIPKKIFTKFKSHSNSLFAQLDLYNDAMFASRNNQTNEVA